MPFYAIMIYWNENFETEENHILNISNDNTKNYKLRYNSKMCKSFNIIITNTFANHIIINHMLKPQAGMILNIAQMECLNYYSCSKDHLLLYLGTIQSFML